MHLDWPIEPFTATLLKGPSPNFVKRILLKLHFKNTSYHTNNNNNTKEGNRTCFSFITNCCVIK